MDTPIVIPSEGEIKSMVNQAIRMLFANDAYLFYIDANERSISHRFAVYLEQIFVGWDVDCEYNRYYRDQKTIRPPDEPMRQYGINLDIDDEQGKTVYPDIIIHKRNTDNNLIAFEIKKTTSTVNDRFDLFKLENYTEQGLNYRYGVFIRFITRRDVLGTERITYFVRRNFPLFGLEMFDEEE